MALLKAAVNQTAYLKAGILGFAGSGKTFTSSEIAIGLAREIGNKKPVAFFDTETGSDYMIPKFKDAGIELLVLKARSFMDLLTVIREAESTCSVLIVDSITHVWQELMESYARKLQRKNGLLFQDWAAIKTEWRQFTDLFLNSRLNIIICGRAGYEYDFETNEAGKKELIKTGIKMKVEGEFGFEPSLLLEMERVSRCEMTGDLKDKGWIHRCTVLKDRTTRMNGSVIDFDPQLKECPKPYESFKPVIQFLNVGGEHVGLDTNKNSESLFDGPDTSYVQRKKQVEITLEEIDSSLTFQGFSGTSAETKKARIFFLEKIFKTSSKTAIEALPLEKLKEGLAIIKATQIEQVLLELSKKAPIPKVNEEKEVVNQ